MKKKIYAMAAAMLLLVLAVSSGVVLSREMDYRTGARDYEAAADTAGLPASGLGLPQPTGPSGPEEEPDPYAQLLAAVDLDELKAVNGDVTGWLLIPDTDISYPLLQTGDNEYYLNHTWSGARSAVGAIFLESTCRADLSGFHTIVYGHNMRNGSMFGSLRYYRDTEYWQAHPAVYLTNGAGVYRYEVFAAYEAGIREIVYRLDLEASSLEEELLSYTQRKSVLDTAIQPARTDRILTLSTCTGQGHTTRWVVQAVLRETWTREAAGEVNGAQ